MSHSRTALFTEIETPVLQLWDHQHEIITYGLFNEYPHYIDYWLSRSGKGGECADIMKTYIEGKGFEDNEFVDIPVNFNLLTIADLLSLVSTDLSKFNGFALHIQYNANLDPAVVRYFPFENVRLGQPDERGYIAKIWECKNWIGINNAHTPFNNHATCDATAYDIFNPSKEVVQAQIDTAGGFSEYKGQVLYFGMNGPGRYPLAPAHSVRDDLEANARHQSFRKRSVKNRFLQNHVMAFPNGAEKDELLSIQKETQKFQGDENAGNILMVAGDVSMQPLEQGNNDDTFRIQTGQSSDSIRTAYHVPVALAGDPQTGKLGNSAELQDAMKIYNPFIVPYHSAIKRTFERIFGNWYGFDLGEWNVSPLTFETENENGDIPNNTQ